jgi:hypothetical protein
VRDVIEEALGLLGVAAPGDGVVAEEEGASIRALNGLLRSLQTQGANLWRITDIVTDVAGGTNEVAFAGVIDIMSARWTDVNAGVAVSYERSLAPWTRAQYDELPTKATTGTPTTWTLIKGRSAVSARLWPIPLLAGRLTVTATRRIQDVTALDQGLDIPGELEDAIVWGLADRLALQWPTAPADRSAIAARAQELSRAALDYDRPQSVYMSPDGAGLNGWGW